MNGNDGASALRILALVTDAWGGRGGISRYNQDFLGAAAASAGVEQIVVLPRHCVDPPSAPGGVHQLSATNDRFAYSARALAVAFSRPVDVVFCGHLFMAPLAWLVAKVKRASLIVQVHGVEAWETPTLQQRLALDAAELVLSVSRYTRTQLLKWASIAPERVVVVPNTVGEEMGPGEAGELPAAWGLAGRKVLLTIARMDAGERYKGHDKVIEALPALEAQGHDLIYLVIGDGTDRARLENLAQERGVSSRVVFAGSQSNAARLAALRAADLFVMPSTGEGFGIAYLEAIACHVPTLGLSAAGARDALGDGALGEMCEPSELSCRIGMIIGSPPKGVAARAAAMQQRFGVAPFKSRVDSVLTRLFEREGRGIAHSLGRLSGTDGPRCD